MDPDMDKNRRALIAKILALPGGAERQQLQEHLDFVDAMREVAETSAAYCDAEAKFREALKKLKNLPDKRAADIAANVVEVFSSNMHLREALL